MFFFWKILILLVRIDPIILKLNTLDKILLPFSRTNLPIDIYPYLHF